ncbi:hypothetical protein Hanom_Chr12g01110631 [Helianthus anomalus]
MKTKHSFRTQRLLDILMIYEAAKGLLLLVDSPPLVVTENGKPFNFVPSTVVGSDFEADRPKDVVDERVDALSADDLMARFLMIRKGGCQLVYHRRKSRRSGQVPVADDKLTADHRH